MKGLGVPYSHRESGFANPASPLVYGKKYQDLPHITSITLKKGLLILYMKGHYSERPPALIYEVTFYIFYENFYKNFKSGGNNLAELMGIGH